MSNDISIPKTSSQVEIKPILEPIVNIVTDLKKVAEEEDKAIAEESLSNAENIKNIVESLETVKASQDILNNIQGRQLMFELNNDSGDYVIKVIDKETNDVIRQIPSEEFVRVAEKIKTLSEQIYSVQGMLFESKA
jgi:flagellar protein FlaG